MGGVRRLLAESLAVTAANGLGLLPYLGAFTWSSAWALGAALVTVAVGALLATRSPVPAATAGFSGLLAATGLFVQYYRVNRAVAGYCSEAACPAPQAVGPSIEAAFWPSLGVALLGLAVAVVLHARRPATRRTMRLARF